MNYFLAIFILAVTGAAVVGANDEQEANLNQRRLRHVGAFQPKGKTYLARKLLVNIMKTCDSHEKSVAILKMSTSISQEVADFEYDVEILPQTEDLVEVAYHYLEFMDKVMELATDSIAECWAAKAMVGMVAEPLGLINTSFGEAMDAVSKMELGEEGASIADVGIGTITQFEELAHGGAEDFRNYVRSVGDEGRHSESATSQVAAVKVMAGKWRDGATLMKDAVNGVPGADGQTWEQIEQQLDAFLFEISTITRK